MIRSLIWLGLGLTVSAIAYSLYPTLQPSTAHPNTKQSASTPSAESPLSRNELAERWIVSPTEAYALITNGATVLDARNRRLQHLGMIDGSVAVSWRQFSEPDAPYQGELLSDEQALTEQLQAVGVTRDRPVVVLADPLNGWGEDGRIAWMLRSLGHTQTVMVDGGYPAVAALGLPRTLSVPQQAPTPGDFVPQPRETWQIERTTLRQQLAQSEVVLVDTRTREEFEGATLYGEARGGHIPGAIHFDYRELMTDEGRLRPPEEMRAILREYGILDEEAGDRPIVAYCTGGIRSGWFAAVLIDLGIPAQNYAGSIWDWAAAPASDYPLQ